MILTAAEVKRRMLAAARAMLIPARIIREWHTLTNNHNRQVSDAMKAQRKAEE